MIQRGCSMQCKAKYASSHDSLDLYNMLLQAGHTFLQDILTGELVMW